MERMRDGTSSRRVWGYEEDERGNKFRKETKEGREGRMRAMSSTQCFMSLLFINFKK